MRASSLVLHLVAVASLGAVVLGQGPPPTSAQGPAAKATPPPAAPAQSAAPAQPGTAPAPTGPAPAAPAPAAFSYRPEGRRDPFISLLRRGTQTAAVTPGVRVPGLKGLAASEVTLRGTLNSQGGYVAILQGADSKTYIVRPGERLADGTIRAITSDAMVILQQVNDPLSLEKQREVRKVLRQTEEERR
jgi:Tfp pilus assembly protein PilP